MASYVEMTEGTISTTSAEKGDEIKCHFKIENISSKYRQVWWSIHDHNAKKRLKSGTKWLSVGSTLGITKYIDMPNSDMHIKYWTGIVQPDDSWAWTDNYDCGTIDLVAETTEGSIFVRARSSRTNAYLDASVYVDSTKVGMTNGSSGLTVPVPGEYSYNLKVKHDDYQDWTESIIVLRGQQVSKIADMVPEPTDATLYIRVYSSETGSAIDAKVYVDDSYVGTTDGTSGLTKTVSVGYHTILLKKDDYQDYTVDPAIYFNAGDLKSVSEFLDPEVQVGSVYVTTVDGWTDAVITGAKVYVGGVDTGETTPCTLDLEPRAVLGYEFTATKDHFTAPANQHVVNANETSSLEIRMQAIGMQCDISLGSIVKPDVFPPPPPTISLPSPLFGFKIPFDVGDFTYYGIGWLASLYNPSPATVASALAKSLVVTVNGAEVTPIYTTGTEDVSFDLLAILQNMDLSDISDLEIEITYATRLWFNTFDFEDNEAINTSTATVTIPISNPFCTIAPDLSGLPVEIPVLLNPATFLPSFDTGAATLPIDFTAVCEGLSSTPTAIPMSLIMSDGGTGIVERSAKPGTPQNIDISSIILAYLNSFDTLPNPANYDNLDVSFAIEYMAKWDGTDFSEPTTTATTTIPLVVADYGGMCDLTGYVTTESLYLPMLPTSLDLAACNVSLHLSKNVCDGTDRTLVEILSAATLGGGIAFVYHTQVAAVNLIGILPVNTSGEGTLNITPLLVAHPLLFIDQPDEITLIVKFASVVTFFAPVSVAYSEETRHISVHYAEPGDIFCDLVAAIDMPSLPLRMSALGLSLDTTDPQTLGLTLAPTCDAGAPDNPFNGLECASLAVGGVTFANLPSYDTSGYASVDLATHSFTLLGEILENLAEGAASGTLAIDVTYPLTVKYSSPTVQEWETTTVNVPFNIEHDTPPECVLTAADYITCDGIMIPIRMCQLDGSKIDIVPTPTCPEGPAPPCVLTADDYITCDGVPIPIRMCLPDGSKVDIVPTPTCPEGPAPPCVLTADDFLACPDGSVIQINECVNNVKVPTGATCDVTPPPEPEPECVDGARQGLYLCSDGKTIVADIVCVNGVWVPGPTCPDTPQCTSDQVIHCQDGSTVTVTKCVNGLWVPVEGAKCPEPEPDTKMVYVIAPLLSRVGKKVKIVGISYCGVTKVGGEKAWVTVNGKLLTTTTTRAGELKATWTPIVPGLYTICVSIPESSSCKSSASSCTVMQVVEELTADEIAASEAEFESAKEWIGQVMERI